MEERHVGPEHFPSNTVLIHRRGACRAGHPQPGELRPGRKRGKHDHHPPDQELQDRSSIISTAASAYIYLFRGTPLIMQVFLIYYGLGGLKHVFESVGLWWFFREAYYCALLAFMLNTAAYQAEILRGAIQSVPRGQWEASNALGIHPVPTFLRVIMPQALMVALRPYGNEIILMVKGSAIVSIVTVFDLMGETKYAFSRTFDFQMYVWAAVLYLAIVELLRNVWNLIERRLTRHLKR